MKRKETKIHKRDKKRNRVSSRKITIVAAGGGGEMKHRDKESERRRVSSLVAAIMAGPRGIEVKKGIEKRKASPAPVMAM